MKHVQVIHLHRPDILAAIRKYQMREKIKSATNAAELLIEEGARTTYEQAKKARKTETKKP